MPCSACKREKKIVARGLCAACYQRWRKTGTTEYQRWGKRNFCQIKDCENPVVSGGLCDKHRKRLERHGHTKETRPDSWGAIAKHPLAHTWKWMLRHRLTHPISQIWESDFLQFVADVGERPSGKHRLFSADETKPIGPDNFIWKRAITEKVEGEDEKTYQARAHRVYRSVRQEAFHEYDLKRNYGLSRKGYEDLHAAQDGKCAICREKESESDVRISRQRKLAVDHCHETGKIRGLLCAKCNQGLGCFRDRPNLLRAAIRYLEGG